MMVIKAMAVMGKKNVGMHLKRSKQSRGQNLAGYLSVEKTSNLSCLVSNRTQLIGGVRRGRGRGRPPTNDLISCRTLHFKDS
jgi:hypothetical protein